MTMHATHRASLYLAFDSLERIRTTDQIANRPYLRLRIDVIEFQDDRIRLSTVDARVRTQVLDYIRAVAGNNPAIRFKSFLVIFRRII